MFAIIESGSKQYKVSVGDKIKIEKIKGQSNDNIIFDKVLLLVDKNETKIGTPYLEKVQVVGKKLKDVKGKKLIVFKYKPKKRYRKKKGHRQTYTEVEILEIKKQ